uniref:C-C motif chemokine 28-like n=1 Tax=Salmo trutta TaxID=8032 RepID=A0A673YVT8_SALTR
MIPNQHLLAFHTSSRLHKYQLYGGIPKCCVKTSMDIPTNLLRKVERAEMQLSNGVCEINALILHVKGKKLCAHPKTKRKLKRLQRKAQKRQKRP